MAIDASTASLNSEMKNEAVTYCGDAKVSRCNLKLNWNMHRLTDSHDYVSKLLSRLLLLFVCMKKINRAQDDLDNATYAVPQEEECWYQMRTVQEGLLRMYERRIARRRARLKYNEMR